MIANEPRGETPHNLILEDRRRLSVSGVMEVISFDDSQVVMETDRGVLTVDGGELHVEKLSLDVGGADAGRRNRLHFLCEGEQSKRRLLEPGSFKPWALSCLMRHARFLGACALGGTLGLLWDLLRGARAAFRLKSPRHRRAGRAVLPRRVRRGFWSSCSSAPTARCGPISRPGGALGFLLWRLTAFASDVRSVHCFLACGSAAFFAPPSGGRCGLLRPRAGTTNKCGRSHMDVRIFYIRWSDSVILSHLQMRRRP